MHCSSSSGGGGGGGGGPAYTCTNGAPSEGSPDGDNDVESCASCNDGYSLVADEAICRKPFFLHSNGITVRCPNAEVGDMGMVNGDTYTKRTVAQIQANLAIAATSCTSDINDMSSMFFITGGPAFNGDISSWDVSMVTNMSNMFLVARAFNRDIGSWNVSNVMSMAGMFSDAIAFNQDIGSWDVSMVTNMNSMFSGATAFNQDLSGWCIGALTEGSGTPLKPDNFAVDAGSFTEPVWGATAMSCP